MPIPTQSFDRTVSYIRQTLLSAPIVEVGEWQGQAGGPTGRMLETEDISFAMEIPKTIKELQTIVKPNLPWAEDHFGERVSGIPHNPPPSAAWWPFKQKDHADHVDEDGQFSHTYPERFWPCYAGDLAHRIGKSEQHHGIRFYYGDLGDVVGLLKERPNSRQAYLPVWFPEDLTAARDGQRVPCTLGYHFRIRNDLLTVVYYIRSCDYLRHFRDDVYLAARLGQWVAEQVGVQPRKLVMHISNMHVFEADRQTLAYHDKKGS